MIRAAIPFGLAALFAWFVALGACAAPGSAIRDTGGPEGLDRAGSRTPARERSAPAAYVDSLVDHARELELAHKRRWLRLGHWRPAGWRPGYESEADGAAFFLSPRGKQDPEAELEADLRGFFSPPAGDDHPLCRFPARFLWLSETLGIERGSLPQTHCPKLERFLKSLRPASATVVFSSYYLSTPASAFGHTLLRINKQVVPGEGGRRELLDTGINYSATVDTPNAILYAFKGLTGMFRGHFSRMPYYYKVREYNDYESRDLWEYQLDLSPRALTYLVAHIWELGSTHFDYYYLSENCSYHLLAALEAADPNLELLAHVKYPVLPADTIKALFENPGLVTSVSYRPSLRTKFRARARKLSDRMREWVERLADDPKRPMPASLTDLQKAEIVDAAVDLVDLDNADAILFQRDSPAARKRQALLARRASIRVATEEVNPPPRRRAMPHLGHGSRRLELGGGVSREQGPFSQVGVRLALHDLADAPQGYPELSEIQFLPVRARYFTDSERLRLHSASLIRIRHLVPIGRFQGGMSWNIDAGAVHLLDRGCGDCYAGRLLLGSGAAVATAGRRLALFGFVDSAVAASPDLHGPLGKVRIGAGPSLGLRMRFHDRLIGLMTGSLRYYPWQPTGLLWSGAATLRWLVAGPFALDLGATAHQGDAESHLSLMAYY